jgi:protein-S-isoprenylcysteine O-methyltransferase Ste14
MVVLVAFRMRAEERMMIEEFGNEYEEYRKRTKRLIPGLW